MSEHMTLERTIATLRTMNAAQAAIGLSSESMAFLRECDREITWAQAESHKIDLARVRAGR